MQKGIDINITLNKTTYALPHKDEMQESGSELIVCGSGSSKFGQCGFGSLTIKKLPNFSKQIYSISLISKSKILLIFKSEPSKP